MIKILLTGGAGFIGSHMVAFLLKQGAHVLNVDALTYAGNLDNLQEIADHNHYTFAHTNICDKAALASLITSYAPDALIHMAAESHVDRSIACADDFIQTNVVGTHRLLEETLSYFQGLSGSKREAFRFLHVSTDEVFGALGPTGVFTENSPYQPNSPYAASKAASDLLARAYHHTYGLPVIIANASNTYGPHQYPEKLIPLVLTRAMAGQPLPVYGDGQQRRDWMYVTDHVEALWALVQKGRVGESYCIGACNEWPNLQLVEKLCQILDEVAPATNPYRTLIRFVTDRLGHDVRYAIDATKLQTETGWLPRMPFEEGLRETVKFYVHQWQKVSACT
jgi:dTDP-glucose 4,6-dehydratase